ncbi:unnamed protein product, partial [Urochloa humidicola]
RPGFHRFSLDSMALNPLFPALLPSSPERLSLSCLFSLFRQEILTPRLKIVGG